METPPRFSGEHLREAREARDLSGTALADLLGVTRQAVSQYEAGKQCPRPDVMEKIYRVLNLPPAFFTRAAAPLPPTPVFYRSLAATTKRARTRAERRYGWLREITAFVANYVDLPAINLPAPPIDDPLALTNADIEALASSARRHWGMGEGPISDLVLLLESNGVIVTRTEFGAETLDGFSQWWDGEHPFVILGTDKGSCARSRFDAAHELGHLLMHRKVDRREFTRASEHKRIEEQANRFASAFLLPQKTFASEVYSAKLDTFKEMKPRWKVSIATMIHRAIDLRFIDEEEGKRLWINRSRRGWRNWEPLDDELEVERPRFLARSFQLLADSKTLSPAEIRAALPFSPKDVEELAGLPRGFLNEPAPIQDITPRLRERDKGESSPSTQRSPEERVIRFPDHQEPDTWDSH